MIFKVYYRPKDCVEYHVKESLVSFDNMKELVERIARCGDNELIYAKEIVGSDEISEYREKYLR